MQHLLSGMAALGIGRERVVASDRRVTWWAHGHPQTLEVSKLDCDQIVGLEHSVLLLPHVPLRRPVAWQVHRAAASWVRASPVEAVVDRERVNIRMRGRMPIVAGQLQLDEAVLLRRAPSPTSSPPRAADRREHLSTQAFDRKMSTLVSKHFRKLKSLAPTSNQLCGAW